MNKPTPPSDPKDMIKSLEQIQPVADEAFKNALETRLTEEWYRQTPHKSKNRNHLPVPITFVASLAILAGVIIYIVPMLLTSFTPLAQQTLPEPTPVPTPDALTPASPISQNDLPVTLEANTVAVLLPVLTSNTDSDPFFQYDVIDIVATIRRDQLDDLPSPIQLEVVELLDEYKTDEISIQLIEDAKILTIHDTDNRVLLQVSQQQAIILTWLAESQIPYKILKDS